MAEYNMSPDQRLLAIRSKAPKELIAAMESLADKLSSIVDIRREPAKIFEPDIANIAFDYAMEGVENVLERFEYEDGANIFMESMTNDPGEIGVPMSMGDAHRSNMRQMMENSVMEARVAHPNQRNLNELTPFDAFLPFTIIRSYLPLVMKDVVPYVTPAKDFIRIKWSYKYIVTKDNQRHLRPDIYNDPAGIQQILDSAKGKRVTEDWYPAGTLTGNDGADSGDYTVDGKNYTVPADKLTITSFDLLAESGGTISVGDQLDKDVCVYAARAKVQNSSGTERIVEVCDINAFPDLTSISPQRSVEFTVKYPVLNDDKTAVESYVEDRVFGSYNDSTMTFDLVSLTGATKQIQFGGHLSNKNNTEYIQYASDYRVEQHPIPEGYRFNAPITPEDMHLYNQTASIDIVANSINEATEMFTEMEDGSVIHKLDTEYTKWVGKKGSEHPFIHFQSGPVVFTREVDVSPANNPGLLKRNQWTQDQISYNLDRMINDIRSTCMNEPYKVILFCHPNIASLFVGDNIDWKIQPGTSIAEGIRTDYNMGIYTSSGNGMRLISSMKFREADGVRFIVLPVNEQNFLTWKHFKYSMYFDRDHRINEMPNVPNIMAMSRFYTHSYIPLQGKLIIKNYDNL